MLRWLIGNILGKIIWESSNWQYIQRLKITILGANWQVFRSERTAKCSYFILSTQNIKFYWFVMKIKKFLLPIWWYNRGSFPLGNKYFGVFVLNGLSFSKHKRAMIKLCESCRQIHSLCTQNLFADLFAFMDRPRNMSRTIHSCLLYGDFSRLEEIVSTTRKVET